MTDMRNKIFHRGKNIFALEGKQKLGRELKREKSTSEALPYLANDDILL